MAAILAIAAAAFIFQLVYYAMYHRRYQNYFGLFLSNLLKPSPLHFVKNCLTWTIALVLCCIDVFVVGIVFLSGLQSYSQTYDLFSDSFAAQRKYVFATSILTIVGHGY